MLLSAHPSMQETQQQPGSPAPLCPACGAMLVGKVVFCPACGTALLGMTGRLPAQRVLAGRYRIERAVARGGMGAVYLAEDLRLDGARVAVKEMSSTFARGDTEAFARAMADFKREAALLARLRHPNLPRVSDRFEEDGKHFLVMEFIQGQTLRDLVRRAGGRLPLATALAVVDQLCDVLGYLHDQQPPIVYRDLKPANIMIEGIEARGAAVPARDLLSASPIPRVVLIDFGIARFYRPGATGDTAVYGTLGYAPPEQYGRGQTDARADIYALGVLLHHLLTGHDPSATPFALPEARALVPSIPPHVAAAIARATASDPAGRFADVAAFRAALYAEQHTTARAVRRPAPAARPTTTAPLPAARAPRGRAFPIWTLIVGMLIVIGVLVLMLLPRLYEPSLNMAAPPGPSIQVATEPVTIDLGPVAEQPQPVPEQPQATAAPPEAISLVPSGARASATSAPNIDSQGNPVSYDAANAIDGRRDTAWRVDGDGSGQSLQIEFASDVSIAKIGVIAGYDKVDPFDNTDRFAQNRVVQRVRLEFSDGTSQEATFAQQREMQFVQLPQPVRTRWVRLVIVNTYPPLQAEDTRDFTPVSEVVVQGAP
jgi:serine/threonine-protein kinase